MRVVTFGEVMLRMCPAENLRLRQVLPGNLEVTFGGGEVNVAVSIAYQGGQSAFLTALPDNPLTDSFVQEIRGLGVCPGLVKRCKTGRFGIYFVEAGANQRGSTVLYDREASCISQTPADAYDWDTAFKDADWFHITGITPALSEVSAQAALTAVQKAKQAGLRVSCDLNFRKKLWKWKPGTSPVDLARQTMQKLVPFVDVLIANEEDADLSLGIAAHDTNVEAGKINVDGYRAVAEQIVHQFPNVSQVAITLRESYSASHNNWGAVLYDAPTKRMHAAPIGPGGEYQPYEIRNIIDRVGAGDSFAAGLIFALRTPDLASPATAIRYAVAASCLKHSIKGDFNHSTRQEIEELMGGSGSGRVSR